MTRSSSTWTKVVIVFILATSCAIACWMRFASGRADANEGLLVDESSLDFGEVWETSSYPWTVSIENPTNRPVEILDLQHGPACVSVEPRALVLPPRQTCRLRLNLDLTKRCLGQEKDLVRDFAAWFVPVVRDGLPKQRGWRVQGRVRVGAFLERDELDYGDTLVEGQEFDTRTVKVQSAVPLADIRVRYDAAKLDASLKPTGASDSYELTVKPQASLKPGAFESDVLLEMVTRGGEKLPDKRLPVRGIVQHDVEPVPATVFLAAIPVGEKARETIVLRSAAGRAFRLKAVTAAGDGTAVQLVGSDSGATKQCAIMQNAVAIGSQSATIRFHVQDQNGSERVIEVPIRYLGVSQRAREPATAGEGG